MSDLNQISEDTIKQNQFEISVIADNLKTISISDDQNVPKAIKQSPKVKDILDDDNNTQSPAYIPRKGKFYEHDDRTFDENDRSKQEISRDENRFYKDFDGKWQHDLYFRDEQILKSRHSIPLKGNQYHSKPHNQKPLHLEDYMVRPHTSHTDRRPLPQEFKRKPPTNNFDFKDSLRYNGNTQTAPHHQRDKYNPYQIDERTFHRRRNFINSQFQQHENPLKFNKNSLNRIDQGNNVYRQYELHENKNNLPPRLRINNSNYYQNSTQKQEYQEKSISNIDRPKRYSNMRNNLTNFIQPQASSSQIKSYQDQRSNQLEQNDWPQAPPPPTSYSPQQQYYQQTTSRYIPINYSQGSIFEQFQANK